MESGRAATTSKSLPQAPPKAELASQKRRLVEPQCRLPIGICRLASRHTPIDIEKTPFNQRGVALELEGIPLGSPILPPDSQKSWLDKEKSPFVC